MTALPSRLSVVTLGARDLPKLREFYRGLGWPDLPAPAGFSGVTLACNVDSEEQVDAAFTAAVAAGATPVAEPVNRDWGGRSAYFADPEGNRWEIAWASSAVFDDRGALIALG